MIQISCRNEPEQWIEISKVAFSRKIQNIEQLTDS